MPPPHFESFLSPGGCTVWLKSLPRRLSAVLVLLLSLWLPLSAPSTSPHPLSPLPPPPPCPEVAKWPIFCSALMNTSILNETSRAVVRSKVIEAQTMFCDMVRVLNKIDCAQPFTVSPRWRIGCQEAYRDWACSLLAVDFMPPGLLSCDSTCHQVIRACPYLTPDRVQADGSGGPSGPHPSQYGGHPAFYCPTTYTHEEHTEGYFFSPTPDPDSPLCILFNPADAGLGPASFPLTSLSLHNLIFTYCHEYSNQLRDRRNMASADLRLLNLSRPVNVSSCCWTYNTALPKTYSYLSAASRRGEMAKKNCVPLGSEDASHLHETDVGVEAEPTVKTIILQCLVSQEGVSFEDLEDPPLPPHFDLYPESGGVVGYYVDDGPPLRDLEEGYNSAEGLDSEPDYSDNEYVEEEAELRRGRSRYTSTARSDFLALVTGEGPSSRARRSLPPPAPSGANNLRPTGSQASCSPPFLLFLLLLTTTNLLPLVLLGLFRGGSGPPRIPTRPPSAPPPKQIYLLLLLSNARRARPRRPRSCCATPARSGGGSRTELCPSARPRTEVCLILPRARRRGRRRAAPAPDSPSATYVKSRALVMGLRQEGSNHSSPPDDPGHARSSSPRLAGESTAGPYTPPPPPTPT